MRLRPAALSLTAALVATAPAQAGPVVTVATGADLGYGPGARLKGWQDEAGGRLCLRVFIPFEIDGHRAANRLIRCVPYPPRRALTARRFSDYCGSGASLFFGVVRADVARVEHTTGNNRDGSYTQDMRLVRVPRLAGTDAIVVGLPAEDNVVRLLDAGGAELKLLSWHTTFPSCPSLPVRFL